MEKRNIVIIAVAAVLVIALLAAAVYIYSNENSSKDSSSDVVKVKSVGLDRTDVQLEVGKSTVLSCTVMPSNAANKAVTWSSSNPSVAVVDGNGKVTAVSVGSAVITVKTVDGEKTASCNVTVPAVVVGVTGLTLSDNVKTLNVGETATIVATVTPSNATNKNVVWESENRSVATVSNGVITAVSEGRATIVATAESGGYKAICHVSVYSPTDDKVLNEGYVFSVDTVAKVLGNANNDDRIDSKDIEYVQGVINKTISYDKSRNPYVDANNDGKVDSKDIEQIQMIIDKKKGTVWYENYYGEVQSIDFPVIGKRIGVTYWQQAQLVDLVGHWSDVVAANASVSTARSNQYDLSNVVYSYGTTGSSKLTEEFCEGYLNAGVDLIIGSPYKATVTEVANTYLPDVPVITLGIGGSSCVSSALTLGILMDAEDRAQKYEEYVVGVVDTIKEGLSDIKNSEKPKMLVCRMYEDNDGYISRYGGILVNCANTDGSYQLLSMFADLYTDNTEKGTTPNRTQEWIMSQDFDLIFDMEVYTGFQTSSIPGEKFYTQGEYNKRFENSVQYFKGTDAYNDGGILSSSYIFDGYSGFASLMMSAHMIYPEKFTLKQGQESLQYWYDNFTVCDVDVTEEGGYYYTGDKYRCQFSDVYPDRTARLLVYGNADNDDYLDKADLKLIERIVASGSWDKEKFPFADANHDGVVTKDDANHLKKLLDGTETTKMWYVGSGDIDYYVNYPNTGNIAVTVDYGLMMGQVLGVYDRIVAGTTKCTTYNTDRYPGVDKLQNLGTYKSTDYADFQENLMKSGCTIVLGYIAPALYDSLRESGRMIDQINLSCSAQTRSIDSDVVSSILTCGVLLGHADEAREYCAFSDSMEAYFAAKKQGGDLSTFLVAYNTNNATTTDIDTHYKSGGCFGDVWTVSHLPMVDIVEPTDTGMTKMDIEAICKDVDPDIIIISMWGVAADRDSPEDVQKIVDERASYFRTSRAYKNGDIYAINYESIGTYMGLGTLGILGSMIWPEDYDSELGWQTFYDFIKEFTLLDVKSVDDLKQCGGIIVYQMTQ